MLLVSGRFPFSKTIIPDAQEHFLTPSPRRDAHLFGGLGVRLSQVFSPATAIIRRDLFQGRRTIIRRLIDAVNQAGQHAIIYGERGVGKTSLANVLASFLEPFTSEEIISVRVNCSRETSYQQIWEFLFRDLGLTLPKKPGRTTPEDVFNTLRADEGRKLILIVDEFDRLGDPDVDTLFADTIKTFSDFSLDTTLILVGVADDVDDLIEEHESIDRCLVQIHLPRMPFEDLAEIVRNGVTSVGMEVSDEAIFWICTVSLGLPHYVHSLGLASGRCAIDNKRLLIQKKDVEGAISALVNESQQTVLREFDLATASPRRENFYFQVLLACALAPTDDLGCFRAADVRLPYSRIMRREMQIPTFARHLHGLSDEGRGAVLQRLGKPHQYRFRFSDPLLQPYVLMRGLQSNLLTLEEAAAFASGQSES